MLAREYPGWRIEEVSAETNLERSLPATFVRAFLRMGSTGMAAMAAPPGTDSAGMAAFGLIWFEYLRGREPGITLRRLALYAPVHGSGDLAARVALFDH